MTADSSSKNLNSNSHSCEREKEQKQNPLLSKSIHSHRHFPSDFFEENPGGTIEQNREKSKKPAYVKSYIHSDKKEIMARHHNNGGFLEPIPNFKYHLSKLQRKIKQESGSFTGRNISKIRIRTSIGGQNPEKSQREVATEHKMYGASNVPCKRSNTNHRNRSRYIGKF